MMESCQKHEADGLDQVLMEDTLNTSEGILNDSHMGQPSISEESEHLKVYLRIRPFTTTETQNGESQDCVSMDPPDTVLLRPPSAMLSGRVSADKPLPHTAQRFQFSQVYGADTTQRELFQGTVKDLVKHVLQGGNSLVFTYGVTNSGKTFTFLGPDAYAGILPRSLDAIFSSMEEKVFTGVNIKPQRCREFTKLSKEQQAEEAAFKSNLMRHFKDSEKLNSSLWPSSSSMLIEEDRLSLHVEADTKFSVWVSFCEIYNESIHDLLEATPSGAPRRTALRLSQDVKGNAFVKDLRWVQVDSAEEAYKVMKLGKKNQSFSSTRLNQLSSRSHSIFSIRVLRIKDARSPRVLGVSELCLCDLAGSERCAKTQNQGERLKEAGNINTSLLILGKCINALRHNQQAKLLQHVPFRESKLTHYLQAFFCGRGKACMIVNINQCASMYDETLSVLKFSAVAQKVVLLPSKPPPITPLRTNSEMSFIGKGSRKTVQSSLIDWESSLEDVQEVIQEDDEDEISVEDTLYQSDDDFGDVENQMHKMTYEQQAALLKQLKMALKKEQAEAMLMEARVREEVGAEFTKIFSEMQKDFAERLARERELLEERAEKRLEIFKKLIEKMSACGEGPNAQSAEMVAALHKETASKNEVITALEKKILETLQEEGRSKEEASAALGQLVLHEEKEGKGKEEEDPRAREETLAALEEERNSKEVARSSLEAMREEVSRLLEERDQHRQEVHELTATLRETQQQVAMETLRAEQASTQEQLKNTKEAQEISYHTTINEQLRQEVCELQKSLSHEREKCESQMLELTCVNEDVAHKKLLLEQLQEKLSFQEAAAHNKAEELRRMLQEQSESTTKQVAELTERLRLREETCEKQLEELREQKASCDHLREQLGEQQHSAEQLKTKLEEASSSRCAAEEEASRLNADLSSLRGKVTNMEEEASPSASDVEVQTDAEAASELEKKLRDKEAHITALQKKLQEAQEQREDDDSHALQEARRVEVERRRELLAVAHEAIALKDAELEKRAQEISRLKEASKQDSDKVRSLSLDLERKEEDTCDLKEKLADYKKQIQQVHNEISNMKDEEKLLRQKLSDVEKAKKQLQSDLTNRDRIIQQIKMEKPAETKSDETLQTYHKARQELEAKQRVIEDMRLALMEQEETQQQMEQVLEEKVSLIQELTSDLGKMKELGNGGKDATHRADCSSHDLELAKQEAARAEESLRLWEEKQLAERHKWKEEKLALIGQIKEAEDKRNQEMRKFVEDRERYLGQQAHLEAQLAHKEQTMDTWRKERDTLVAALEVQLQKLLASQADKDKLIQQLRQNRTETPVEGGDSLAAPLVEREGPTSQLKDPLKAAATHKDQQQSTTQVADGEKVQGDAITNRKSPAGSETRTSVSSEASSGCPTVLDSSHISTENGKASRFPQPELEISFSPLQPNRMALRRQGQDGAVTVKITRSARKRKSSEMEKQDEVEAENQRNTKVTPTLNMHQEESPRPAAHPSQSSIRSRKEGTLQKIGDFLQSSPTLLGTKAKKMMSLVSGRSDVDFTSSSSTTTSPSSSSSSISLRVKKKNKRKLFRPEISSPMDIPAHSIVSSVTEEKEGDHAIIRRCLRSAKAK
ncbi:kinesin-like protein KIF20B isoform X2 [Dunckerocampus dactyliophorus]|uniref:kinesin-like protein KIF20B isoform X2 n=1 Tax=Dunckerocampus dactyliophorus TaxID=161453 RepID=UPI00240610F6|nr:kinesin-like protein KIF20B isoform X2 [Dunckerocampus dactyliophorus]